MATGLRLSPQRNRWRNLLRSIHQEGRTASQHGLSTWRNLAPPRRNAPVRSGLAKPSRRVGHAKEGLPYGQSRYACLVQLPR